jgi:hypothetical protein
VLGCCGLALLLFFFPLQVVEDSAGGRQQPVLSLTGYDAVLRLVDALNTGAPDIAPQNSDSTLVVADWLTSFAFLAAFVFSGVALVAAAKNKRVARILCLFGFCSSVVAILYTGNLAISAKTAEPLPPPGLARDIMADIVKHVEKSLTVKPGWAAYALAALLGLGVLFTFMRNRDEAGDDAFEQQTGDAL